MRKMNWKLISLFICLSSLASVSQASNSTLAPHQPGVGDYVFANGECQKIIQMNISSDDCDNLVIFHYPDYAAGPSYRYLAETQSCVLLVDPEGHPQCKAPKSSEDDSTDGNN